MDLIILIFLTLDIGKVAQRKGLKTLRWKIYNVVGFIVAEIIGAIAGLMIFGKDNIISIFLVGLAFAISSYYFIKGQLNKLPDHHFDDDINNLGRNN